MVLLGTFSIGEMDNNQLASKICRFSMLIQPPWTGISVAVPTVLYIFTHSGSTSWTERTKVTATSGATEHSLVTAWPFLTRLLLLAPLGRMTWGYLEH